MLLRWRHQDVYDSREGQKGGRNDGYLYLFPGKYKPVIPAILAILSSASSSSFAITLAGGLYQYSRQRQSRIDCGIPQRSSFVRDGTYQEAYKGVSSWRDHITPWSCPDSGIGRPSGCCRLRP